VQLIGAVLNPYPEDHVTVVGYSTTSEGASVDLAERRARAVKLDFIAAGVAASRIDTKGVPGSAAVVFPKNPEITDPLDVHISADAPAR